MLAPLLALLGILGLASAASPAKATYCSEDNLLRAFQHTPTPASKYCTTATGYPTFLAVTSYPATRLSSACSCFSRFPTEGVAAPACTPTIYSFSAVGAPGADTLSFSIKIDLTQTCASGSGHPVTAFCGVVSSPPNNVPETLGFDPSMTFAGADYCFDPTKPVGLTAAGIDVTLGTITFNLSGHGTYVELISNRDAGYENFDGTFTPVPCGSSPPCQPGTE